MPPEVEQEALKQLGRLERMHPDASEASMLRTYIDWLVETPWSKPRRTISTSSRAKAILDEDHYDLTKIKERILEYLAVRKLKDKMKGPILCFAGPPGVGKTSLGTLDRPRHGPRIRAHLARRRERRSRNPRPPPHLRRRASRAASSRA